ncbi:hypothetical protein D9M69_308940 [compost metagenome]
MAEIQPATRQRPRLGGGAVEEQGSAAIGKGAGGGVGHRLEAECRAGDFTDQHVAHIAPGRTAHGVANQRLFEGQQAAGAIEVAEAEGGRAYRHDLAYHRQGNGLGDAAFRHARLYHDAHAGTQVADFRVQRQEVGRQRNGSAGIGAVVGIEVALESGCGFERADDFAAAFAAGDGLGRRVVAEVAEASANPESRHWLAPAVL